MRTTTRAVSVVVALLATAAPAAGAPERDLQIRPGVGIGKVRLGMTLGQVRRVLGPPQVLNRDVELGFGRVHREYVWGWFEWTVALRGAPDGLRVVRVATTRRKHRHRGIGVGSTVRALVRVFPRATCRATYPGGTQVLVRTAGGRQLRFEIVAPPKRGTGFRATPGPMRVSEVIVQEALPPHGVPVPVEASAPCSPGWRGR